MESLRAILIELKIDLNAIERGLDDFNVSQSKINKVKREIAQSVLDVLIDSGNSIVVDCEVVNDI